MTGMLRRRRDRRQRQRDLAVLGALWLAHNPVGALSLRDSTGIRAAKLHESLVRLKTAGHIVSDLVHDGAFGIAAPVRVYQLAGPWDMEAAS